MRTRNSVVVLIPIHKTNLEDWELFSIRYSLQQLAKHQACFLVPNSLDISELRRAYPQCSYARFDDRHFLSVESYSRLLVTESFYTRFSEYEFLLILQPDAIIFQDDLDYWCNQPYDYIGAPWHEPFEFIENLDKFRSEYARNIRIYVGNGGLSLRRTASCLSLLREFKETCDYFLKSGSNEDFFFSIAGALAENFKIPNQITASTFSTEQNPQYFYEVNGNTPPMGCHRWHSVNCDFWRKVCPDIDAFLSGRSNYAIANHPGNAIE